MEHEFWQALRLHHTERAWAIWSRLAERCAADETAEQKGVFRHVVDKPRWEQRECLTSEDRRSLKLRRLTRVSRQVRSGQRDPNWDAEATKRNAKPSMSR